MPDVTDPREAHDDLLVEQAVEPMDESGFVSLRTSEAARSGWVAGALVVDAADRVLLAYDADDGAWMVPGGTLRPGESLREGLVREVREETGVTVAPGRPRALSEFVGRHDDRTAGFRFVLFDAAPEDTDPGDPTDLGDDDETITDVDWFDALPENTYEREFAARTLARVRDAQS